MSNFEDRVLAKIVEQFFVGYSYDMNGYIQTKDAPVTMVSKELYREMMPEIVAAVAKQIDKKKFFDGLGEAVTQAFQHIPTTNWDRNTFQADVRKEMVKLAAQAQLNALEENTPGATT